jgi:hypothetical protein
VIKQLLTHYLRDHVVVDLDLSAAHINIAASLMGREDTLVSKAVKSPEFWVEQVAKIRPKFDGIEEMPIKLSDQNIKDLLKAALYTSLNGGYQKTEANLINYIKGKAPLLFEAMGNTQKQVKGHPAFKKIGEILQNMELVQEMAHLNEKCRFQVGSEWFVHTIDRKLPYQLDKPHQGISRYSKESKSSYSAF